jgi:hypothetical protein
MVQLTLVDVLSKAAKTWKIKGSLTPRTTFGDLEKDALEKEKEKVASFDWSSDRLRKANELDRSDPKLYVPALEAFGLGAQQQAMIVEESMYAAHLAGEGLAQGAQPIVVDAMGEDPLDSFLAENDFDDDDNDEDHGSHHPIEIEDFEGLDEEGTIMLMKCVRMGAKLDVFHAMQRLTKRCRKSHGCFKYKSILKGVRRSVLPPKELEERLNKVVAIFAPIVDGDSGKKFFQKKAIKKFRNLIHHIRRNTAYLTSPTSITPLAMLEES